MSFITSNVLAEQNRISPWRACLLLCLQKKKTSLTLPDVCVKEAKPSGALLLHIWFVTATSHQVVG